MSKKKKHKNQEKFWYTMESFPHNPEKAPEIFPKLIWWDDSWAFVSWDEGKRKWLQDDGNCPFDSDIQPTEWALVPPPPFRAMLAFIKEMDAERAAADVDPCPPSAT